MSYIYPNTDIVLCRDVPLDDTYINTLTFSNANAQQAYFINKAYKTVQNNSYQRTMDGKLRIQCSIGEAMTCNYLYFRNNSFENKIIYCFITGWKYINNETTEITYEVDAFQTFWYDIRWLDCFVEREHTNDDTIGANLIPENLEIGDYKVAARTVIQPTYQEGVVDATGCLLLFTTFNYDTDLTPFTGDFHNFVFTGLNMLVITSTQVLHEFMDRVQRANKMDGVIAAYMIPFTPATYENISWDKNVSKNTSSIDGYVPKNNKLFTAPYNILRVTSDCDSQEYKWENFYGSNQGYVQFRMVGTSSPEPSLTLMPVDYEISSGNIAYPNRMTIKGFPQVALDADVYKVYLAQNAASLPTSMISSGIGTVLRAAGSALSGDVGGVANSIANFEESVANKLAQLHDISTKPPQLNGTQTTCADYSLGLKNFIAEALTIKQQFARVIDGYFTMFGYATHLVKTPNITGRRFWNYIKTKGLTVDGISVPSVYLDAINKACNTGITFWHINNSAGITDIVGKYTTLNNVIE